MLFRSGALDIANAVTLTGGGTVTLDTIQNNGDNAYMVGNGQTLTNTNNTIQGTGIIGNGNLVLVNEALIDATPEGGSSTLTLNGGGITNTSTMEASAGGVLVINTTVDNAGGNITTADATSTVEISDAAVEGGTLNNTAGGTFETVNGAEYGFIDLADAVIASDGTEPNQPIPTKATPMDCSCFAAWFLQQGKCPQFDRSYNKAKIRPRDFCLSPNSGIIWDINAT